ncbi:hypothetical protein BSKO_08522 [Bryopsis sp. KO-2023]|nr:hypothetical protein BSKO_08522 [Bryopsis sp. KO-2023]
MRELKNPTTGELCRHVCELQKNLQAKQLASSRNLDIVNISWDDCARHKGSVWGPCISDMTLVVEDENNQPHRMPIIRHPNFSDLTWDVPMGKIPLVVGNQKQSLFATPLQSVALDTFLENISAYTDLTCPSLKAPRDSHALVSAQACFLPIQEGEKVNFHVELYNYQAKNQDPPVLVMVATSKGTSVQVLDRQNDGGIFNVGGQKLWFNNAGQKCTFTAMRLKDDRAERGAPLTGPMTSSEKQNNVIVVIQVPLQQKQRTGGGILFGGDSSGGPALFGGAPSGSPGLFGRGLSRGRAPPPFSRGFSRGRGPPLFSRGSSGRSGRGSQSGGRPFVGAAFGAAPPAPSFSMPPCQQGVDVEPAIVGLGQSQGPFPALKDYEIKRDERFPVRVTIQWYKSTTNGVVDGEVIDSIAMQMEEAKSKADWWGSLVVGDFDNRRTTAASGPQLFPVLDKRVKHDAFCDKCGNMIMGVRYRCSVCPDFDLCEGCEAMESHGHPPNHLFLRVKRGGQDAYGRNPLLYNAKTQVHSCFCNECRGRIVGARFRCTVCPDFDMCAACEATCGHANFRHPLLKMYHDAPSNPPQLFGAQ